MVSLSLGTLYRVALSPILERAVYLTLVPDIITKWFLVRSLIMGACCVLPSGTTFGLLSICCQWVSRWSL